MASLQQTLLNGLVYLDNDFIADRYEVSSGNNAATTITRVQGKKAGASLLPFSAEISAQETRSYSLSTLGMLAELWPELAELPAAHPRDYAERLHTEYGWVQGTLSTFHVRSGTLKEGKETVTAQSSHFQLRVPELGRYIDLITTPDYFSSGFNALLPLQMTLLSKFALPVCVYLRLLPAKDHAENWIAVPLLIVESHPALLRDLQALV